MPRRSRLRSSIESRPWRKSEARAEDVVVHVRDYERADAEDVAGLLGEMGYPTSPERAAAFAHGFVERAEAALLVEIRCARVL